MKKIEQQWLYIKTMCACVRVSLLKMLSEEADISGHDGGQ